MGSSREGDLLRAPSWPRAVSKNEFVEAVRVCGSLPVAIESLSIGNYPAVWYFLNKYAPDVKQEMLLARSFMASSPDRRVILCRTGCGRPARAQKRASEHGLCVACYNQRLRGRPVGMRRVSCVNQLCVVELCEEIQYAKNLCNFHYQRLRLKGDPGPVEAIHLRAATKPRWNRPGVERKCRVNDCTEVPSSSDQCETHRSRERSRVKAALKAGAGLTSDEWRSVEQWSEVLLGDPCAYCGRPSSTIDHVLATSRGGSWRTDNLVGACLLCNSGKCDTSLLVYLMRKRERQEVMV